MSLFISGVIVSCRPGRFAGAEAAIASVPGAEIHQGDAPRGRYVVVIAEDTIEAETERFSALKKLPDVIDVSLVVHREVDEDDAGAGSAPGVQS